MLISTKKLDFFPQVNIISIPDQEFLPSVVDYIKQSLELRKWGSHWSMYNFNYEYMTFLYVAHVYMFCNVVLYCIALPARVLVAIKIIIYYIKNYVNRKITSYIYLLISTKSLWLRVKHFIALTKRENFFFFVITDQNYPS
jgi:hypothetical protein